MTDRNPMRRKLLRPKAATASLAAVSGANAQARWDIGDSRKLCSQRVPEPPPQSGGPIRRGRGTVLTDEVPVITEAARGINADIRALSRRGPMTYRLWVSDAANTVTGANEVTGGGSTKHICRCGASLDKQANRAATAISIASVGGIHEFGPVS